MLSSVELWGFGIFLAVIAVVGYLAMRERRHHRQRLARVIRHLKATGEPLFWYSLDTARGWMVITTNGQYKEACAKIEARVKLGFVEFAAVREGVVVWSYQRTSIFSLMLEWLFALDATRDVYASEWYEALDMVFRPTRDTHIYIPDAVTAKPPTHTSSRRELAKLFQNLIAEVAPELEKMQK